MFYSLKTRLLLIYINSFLYNLRSEDSKKRLLLILDNNKVNDWKKDKSYGH